MAHPLVRYVVYRLGIFALVAAVCLVTPLPWPAPTYIRLAAALLLSALASRWLLRGSRQQIALWMARRYAQRAPRD